MAAPRLVVELTIGGEDVTTLMAIARSRTEPASRVERARMLLAYRDEPSFFAVGRLLGVHHQTVQRCIERAAALGPLAALDDSARPGKMALGDEREVPNNAPNGRNSIVEGRPIPPKLELRPLTTLSRADLQEATTMLTYAFDEHPLFQLAFPKVASRSKILQTLFTTVLKDAIRFGRVEVACSHKIVGMLIWYPPGCYPMPNSPDLAFVAALCAPCCGKSRQAS